MKHVDAANWLRVLATCGVQAAQAVVWAPLFERHVQADRFSLGRDEMDDFVGQVLVETGNLKHLVEDLNYGAQRLTEVWPRRFPSVRDAIPYAWNPQALAERAYGRRLGNKEPGDAFAYRGRGIPMITGKANYQLLEELTGLPLVAFPDLLADPDVALRCGIEWWERRVPDAAINTVERVTRAVQGGQLALEDRRRKTDAADRALA